LFPIALTAHLLFNGSLGLFVTGCVIIGWVLLVAGCDTMGAVVIEGNCGMGCEDERSDRWVSLLPNRVDLLKDVVDIL
jgi:hypothetical protein